jgi:hypothetical protein
MHLRDKNSLNSIFDLKLGKKQEHKVNQSVDLNRNISLIRLNLENSRQISLSKINTQKV